MTAERGNIGPGRDSFVGRSRELEELEDHLERHRLVTILGEGGAGKTRLAHRFGTDTEAFDEVWWCDLVHVQDSRDLVASVAETLEIEIAKSASAAELGEAMSERGSMLVILDNLEQIAESAARAVDVWLETAPNVSFLATSRAPLRIRGEIRLQLEPLETEAAVDLFRLRARERQADFELDDANREGVERIVGQLDGLPLAIELAASRITLYTVDELSDKLEASIEVLRSDSRSVEKRHRTMRDAIAWSWELLDKDERQLLAETSVFVGGFSLEAAREVLIPDRDRPVTPVVESLVDNSLLRRVSAEERSRFDILEPVREFADEKLTDQARESIERRHARYFADLILEVHRPRIGRDVDNVVAAFWNIVDCDAQLGAEAALASYMLLRNRGAYPKIRAIVERAMEETIDDDTIAAKLHGVQARCLLHDGAYREAPQVIERGLKRAEAAGDASSEVFLNSLRARIANALGKPETARGYLGDAIEGAERLDDPWLESTLRGRLANIEFDRGEFEAAEKQITETILFCRTHEVADVRAHALTTAARFHASVGDVERAESLLERAVEVHPGGEEWFSLKYRAERGFLAKAQGDEEAARSRFERALEKGERVGNRRRRIRILYGLSEIEDGSRESGDESPLLEILEIVEDTDDVFHQVQARTRLGVSRLRVPRYPASQTLLEEAYRRADDFELPRIRPHVGCWLAVASAGVDESERAEALLERAAQAFKEEEAEQLASEVDAFFRPIVEICGADDMPDQSAVVDLRRRLEDLSQRRSGDPNTRVWPWRGWDHREQLVRVLEAAVAKLQEANPESKLRVARDGSQFIPPGGDRVDLRTHEALRRILRSLAERRTDESAEGLSADDLVGVGWPDDVVTDDAGKARVYTAIRNLRSAGLDGLLETGPQGYHLDPEIPFAWLEE